LLGHRSSISPAASLPWVARYPGRAARSVA
jgi:hypothetical protein